MVLMLAGCILFLASHFLGGYRGRMEAVAGRFGYLGAVVLGASVAMVMIVVGYKQMEMQMLWPPVPSSYPLALYLMPLASVLFVAGNIPCNIARIVPHPMLTGIALWAGLHLLANGDLASTIIFLTFGGYALYRRFAAPPKQMEAQPLYRDLAVIAIGAALYALMWELH